MKRKKTAAPENAEPGEKESSFVGPEGQAFTGHDSHPGNTPSRRLHPGTNQVKNPEARESTVSEPYEDLARNRSGPDHRHN